MLTTAATLPCAPSVADVRLTVPCHTAAQVANSGPAVRQRSQRERGYQRPDKSRELGGGRTELHNVAGPYQGNPVGPGEGVRQQHEGQQRMRTYPTQNAAAVIRLAIRAVQGTRS